jgi:hypothetical protein
MAAARDIAAMPTRETRLERNQEAFRSANERLGNLVGDRVGSERTVPFLCECPDEDCMEAIPVTISEYEEVHSHPKRFLVVSGHPTTAGERMVEDRDGYWIVEKGDAQ